MTLPLTLTDSQPTIVLAAGKIWHTGSTHITIVLLWKAAFALIP